MLFYYCFQNTKTSKLNNNIYHYLFLCNFYIAIFVCFDIMNLTKNKLIVSQIQLKKLHKIMFECKIDEFLNQINIDVIFNEKIKNNLYKYVNDCINEINYMNNNDNVYDINLSLFDFIDDETLYKNDFVKIIKIDYSYQNYKNELKTRHELYCIDCDYDIFNYEKSCLYIMNIIMQNKNN